MQGISSAKHDASTLYRSCIKAGALKIAIDAANVALYFAGKAAHAVLKGAQWTAVLTAKGVLSAMEGALQLVRPSCSHKINANAVGIGLWLALCQPA